MTLFTDEAKRFWNICAESLQSAKMGQYDDNSPAALRTNLEEQSESFEIDWASNPDHPGPFSMLDPGAAAKTAMIDEAVACLTAFQAAKAGA